MRAVLTTAILLTAACGGGGDLPTREVTAVEFGEAWPLVVDGGTFICDTADKYGAGYKALYFQYKDRMYSVNGTARDSEYPFVAEIWRGDPFSPEGPRLHITGFIAEGNKACGD